MPTTQFRSNIPDHLLNRKLVLNGENEYTVNGNLLASASVYFKSLLVEICRREKEEVVKNETLISQKDGLLPTLPLQVKYNDIEAFNILLNYCHSAIPLKTKEVNLDDGLLDKTVAVGLNLQFDHLVLLCVNYVEDNITDDNCWLFWKTVVKHKSRCLALRDVVSDYILTNFYALCSRDEFLQIDVEDFAFLLEDDCLSVHREYQLFECIERWVAYKEKERIPCVQRLLACLRMAYFSNVELDTVCDSKYVSHMAGQCELLTWARVAIQNREQDMLTENFDNDTIRQISRSRMPAEVIFVVGGWEGAQNDAGFGPSATIQIYDACADRWRRYNNQPFALDRGHAYSGCVLLNNKIYVVGGYVHHSSDGETGVQGPTQETKAFCLKELRWQRLAPMHEKRNYIAVGHLDNWIYAVGGHNGRERLESVERFNIEQNRWENIAPMRYVRSDAGVAGAAGAIYVCGGFDGSSFFRSVERYDPNTDEWTIVTPMTSIRSGVSVVCWRGLIYAIGGNNGESRLSTCEVYDPIRDTWQPSPSMNSQRSNFCVTVMSNRFYVMGGWSDQTGSTIGEVEHFDPLMDSEDTELSHWQIVSSLQVPASANACCTLTDRNVIRAFLED